jgi:hypothetical protein
MQKGMNVLIILIITTYQNILTSGTGNRTDNIAMLQVKALESMFLFTYPWIRH